MVEKGPVVKLCAVLRTDPDPAPTMRTSEALAAFATAERAKRRLIAELHELKLPIVGRDEDPEFGLAFDLLSSEQEKVFTGHANGVITLDLAEGDDVHREQLRVAMDEPYRTLLGHFRHEIGHYYFYRLVSGSPDYLQRFNELFGDPDLDYQAALDRHYSEGAPAGWKSARSYRPMPRCIRPRTGPRPSLTICTSATPWTPRRPSASPRRAPPSTGAVLGPSGFDTIIDLSAAAGLVAEHGQSVDGASRPVPVRAARGGAGRRCVSPHTVIEEVTS